MAVNPVKGLGLIAGVNRPRVFICGGTGQIGAGLVRHLKNKNYYVHMVSRWENWTEPLCGAHDACTWKDLNDWGLPPDTKAVINLAGSPWQRRYWQDDASHTAEALASRMETNHALKRIIDRSSCAPIFITASSTGIYSEGNERLDENGAIGGSKVSELWQAVEETANTVSPKSRTVIMRHGIVLGRTGGHHYRQRAWSWWGVGGPYGSGKNIMPWIGLEDLCRLYADVLTDDQYQGPVNAVAPQKITQKEWASATAYEIKSVQFLRYPKALVNFWCGTPFFFAAHLV
eukprot:TRINITY_DN39078_c0_g1_i2.p1 TRINITY_DN39078_c0_g1~~TRINITY_DN39078_c0_g1_i2.p1  ORF type:complete len:288 (-),score=19.18 TRINITY_DN39078_c0_g1_i2:15-878(-)